MIRIGIVDDHKIVREALKGYFLHQPDIQVVGEGSCGMDAMEMVRNSRMDVLVMDMAMPGQSGLDAIAMLRADFDGGILILSGHDEEQYAVTLIEKGASGYLNKQCDPAEILLAVRTIALGRKYISPRVAELAAGDGMPHQILSTREFQVFLKLSQGESGPAIARELSLSVKTIATYRARILEKMHLLCNCDMTRYAVTGRLI